MATWFTADLHLGHHNIIVWIVGDFALGKIAETLPLVAALTGHKILIAGNHDRCWARHDPVRPDEQARYHLLVNSPHDTEDRLLELRAVVELAGSVLHDGAVQIWMRTNNPGLAYEAPLNLVESGQSQRVVALLLALAEGVTA